jgi:hypothetical protein
MSEKQMRDDKNKRANVKKRLKSAVMAFAVCGSKNVKSFQSRGVAEG